MLALYLGVVEISQGIGADRKVTMTARTVADLVSQTSNVSNSDMTNSLNAADGGDGAVPGLQPQGHGVEHRRSTRTARRR